MARQHVTQDVLFAFATCFLLSRGARMRPQLDAESIAQIGPEGEPVTEGVKYACMKKWRSEGISGEGFVEQYCLANLDKALDVASGHLEFAPYISACQSTSYSHKMKLCALKGEKPDGKLSYSTKSHVPKSCFRFSGLKKRYDVIEASIGEEECKAALKLPVGKQGVIGKAITTTTTEPTTTTSELEASDDYFETIECNCEDGFAGEVIGKECVCNPAPCDISGSIDLGPDCKCRDGLSGTITWSGAMPFGECLAEVKNLFVEGEEKTWEYNDKSIKCCVSSAGKPTQLQDMTAELPAARSYGTKTGCGYMFGDTYHNGLKDAEPTCTTTIDKIQGVTGAAVIEVMRLLGLE